MRSTAANVLILLVACMVGNGYSRNSLSVLVTLRGESPNEHLGETMAGAGDVNGDGLADFIVGDARGGWSHTGERRCFLYLGNTSLQPIPDVVIHQPELDTLYHPSGDDDRFGKVVSGGGDLNGDGFDDLVITSPDWWIRTGKIYAYYGGDPMDVEPDIGLVGAGSSWMTVEWATELRGRVVRDVNDDGYDELVCLVGDLTPDAGAYLYFGGAPMDSVHDLGFQGTGYPVLELGSDIAHGDVNGDGYVDLVVATSEGSEEDVAWVYLGGAVMDTIPDIRLTSTGPYLWYCTVCVPGDLNGDGFDDVAVCPTRMEEGGRRLASVYFGGPRMDGIADLYLGETLPPGGPMRLAGGDLNLDGYPDLIVSWQLPSANEGVMAAYFGGADMDDIPDIEILGAGSFGEKLAWIGDMTGDGYPEFAVSNPDGAGEIFLYTMGEVGTPRSPLPLPDPVVLMVTPNPSGGPFRIAWCPHTTAPSRVEVLDLTGRAVRRMNTKSGGPLVWDSRDDAGQSVPNGVYVIRVDAGAATYSKRAIAVR